MFAKWTIRVTELRPGHRARWLLLVAATVCATACTTTMAGPSQPLPYAMHSYTSVELRWPGSESARPEPPVFIDGSWLIEGGAVVPLTASVYSSFPSAARARRRHPVRIVPRQTLGVADDDAPRTLFNSVELEIILDTEPSRWSQYAYQLAHELCHVLILSPAIHNLATWEQQLTMPNGWMEEMLCELASFQVLPQVARSWAEDPPFPGASSYAANFSRYIEQVRTDDAEKLPTDMSFAAWMLQKADYLRQQPYDRPRNATVAVRMLPLFESRPSLWTCVTYLDVDASGAERDRLPSLIRGWRTRAPGSCRADIDAFASVLGVSLD